MNACETVIYVSWYGTKTQYKRVYAVSIGCVQKQQICVINLD